MSIPLHLFSGEPLTQRQIDFIFDALEQAPVSAQGNVASAIKTNVVGAVTHAQLVTAISNAFTTFGLTFNPALPRTVTSQFP